MKPSRRTLNLALYLTLICSMTPLIASGQTAEIDTFAVWAGEVRALRHNNIDLRRELADAQDDLARVLAHRETDKEQWAEKEEWLREMIPKWYERPELLIPAAVLITVWATLKIVQVSI